MNTDKEIIDYYCEKEENLRLEFKASMQYDVVNQNINKNLAYNVVKAICSMMNTNGGKIIVGFFEGDKEKNLPKKFIGIEKDGKKTFERWQDHLNSKLKQWVIDSDLSGFYEIIPRKYKTNITCAEISVEPYEDLVSCTYADTDLKFTDRPVYWVRKPGRVEELHGPLVQKYRRNRKLKFNKKIQQGWTIDPQVSLISYLSKGWLGGFAYKEVNKKVVPKNKGGIYILTAEEKEYGTPFDKMKTIVYVGKANGNEGFRERFIAHFDQDDFLSAIDKYSDNLKFWYKAFTDKNILDELKFLERNIIENYGPTINTLIPTKKSMNKAMVTRGRD